MAISPSSCHLGNVHFFSHTSSKLPLIGGKSKRGNNSMSQLAVVLKNNYVMIKMEISVQEKLRHEELKEKIRLMLVETPDNSTQKLVLIDTIQRLGVAYHFKNDIEISIHNIFEESRQNENDDALYVVALRFRLVRQQRHYISSDVFKRFTNHDGKFNQTLTKDVHGLLNLYEAAHLRVHEEKILDEALSFTITCLESMGPKLDILLKDQVSEALSHPIHTNLPRLSARKYICMYENIELHNDLLLEFAKLDFNIAQKVYQRELNELTRWWKDLDVANKFSYARDRLVESYYGVLGVYFDPQQSRARKIIAKLLAIITVVDDAFDAYATFDEIVLFTNAIERCDISAMDSVSPNLRPAYQVLIELLSEMEEELKKEGKADRVYYVKVEMKKWIRAYFKEAQWLNAGSFPKCEEYMENAIISIAIKMIASTSLVCMEEFITKETFEWIINDPLIIRASTVISRLKDDIIGHHFEQQREHIPSFIECYIKEYGASMQEAYGKVEKKMSNAWKDINTELLRPSKVPMFALEQAINPTRLVLGFEENDFINSQSEFRDKIVSLLVDPIKI